MTQTTPITISNFHDHYANIDWSNLTTPVQFDRESGSLYISYPCHFHQNELHTQLSNQLPTETLNVHTQINRHKPQGLLQPLKKIKNIIAINANKGGVGKSTIAANIAASLAQTGCRVGLLDGDLYGPNQPQLIGHLQKTPIQNEQYQPIERHQLSIMSMGFLIDQKTPLIWRGPMASAYFQQMVFKTNWPELDYLILDCPPGTGDILLTMTQKIPISGVVLATTPQCLSLNDCIKGVAMLKKMQIPILGYIENMSSYTCMHCHKVNQIFPKSTLMTAMKDEKINYLGSIPLDRKLTQSTKDAKPWVSAHPQDTLSKHIQKISIHICAKLACQPLATKNLFTSTKPDKK